LDLFYVPHFNIPVLYPGKLVTAIPDLIMHTFSTEKGTTLPKPYFRLKKLVYKIVFWWAAFRSKKIIVPSKDVLNDFKKVYPSLSQDKFVLAYEGVDPDFLTPDPNIEPKEVLNNLGIKPSYLLYVSSAYEHKNLSRLIQAFKILVEKYGYTGQLVIIGKKDKFSEKIRELVEEENLQDKILMPGLTQYVKDKEIVAVRTQAQLYIFPSLKEGFSLTPMEGQAVGLPAIISDIPVHREIYGDSVEYFDPMNAEDMAQKTNALLHDDIKKAELRNMGCDLVKKYSWDETARITYEVFDKLLQLA
jgi:glycosyltransferase involved in cell wall biosynthesis